jgi:hypothetical protein
MGMARRMKKAPQFFNYAKKLGVISLPPSLLLYLPTAKNSLFTFLSEGLPTEPDTKSPQSAITAESLTTAALPPPRDSSQVTEFLGATEWMAKSAPLKLSSK